MHTANEFSQFLLTTKGFTSKAASDYVSTANYINRMLKTLSHGTQNSIYEISTARDLTEARKLLDKDLVFKSKNEISHNRFTAVLSRYGEFIASFPPQHLPSIVQAPTPTPVKEEAEPINDEKQNVDNFSGWLRQQDAYASSAEKIPDAVNQISDFLFQTKAISKPITKMTSKDEVAPTLDILSSYTFAINAYLGYLKDNTPPQYQIHQMLSL